MQPECLCLGDRDPLPHGTFVPRKRAFRGRKSPVSSRVGVPEDGEANHGQGAAQRTQHEGRFTRRLLPEYGLIADKPLSASVRVRAEVPAASRLCS